MSKGKKIILGVTGSTLAGGLALGLIAPGAAKADTPVLKAQYWGEDAALPREVTAWVVIDPDDTVTLLHYEQLNPLSVPFWSRQGYRPLWTTWQATPASAFR